MDTDFSFCSVSNQARFLFSDLSALSECSLSSCPQISWVEKEDTCVLKLFLPGYKREDLGVQLQGEKSVKVSGRLPKRGYSFSKRSPIPDNIDTRGFTFSFNKEPLRIKLNKSASGEFNPPLGLEPDSWEEEADAYLLKLYFPGYEREHLEVQFDGEKSLIRSGRYPIDGSDFSQNFPIPENADIAGFSCTFEKLELCIRCSKLKAPKERKDDKVENKQSNISSASTDGKVDRIVRAENVKNVDAVNLYGNYVVNMNINRLG